MLCSAYKSSRNEHANAAFTPLQHNRLRHNLQVSGLQHTEYRQQNKGTLSHKQYMCRLSLVPIPCPLVQQSTIKHQAEAAVLLTFQRLSRMHNRPLILPLPHPAPPRTSLQYLGMSRMHPLDQKTAPVHSVGWAAPVPQTAMWQLHHSWKPGSRACSSLGH